MTRNDGDFTDQCPGEETWQRGLTDGAGPSLRQHLLVCSRCRGAWDEHHRFATLCRTATAASVGGDAAARMRRALLDAAALNAEAPRTGGREERRGQSSAHRWMAYGLTAAAGLLLALGVAWLMSQQSSTTETSLVAGWGEEAGSASSSDALGEEAAPTTAGISEDKGSHHSAQAMRGKVMAHAGAEFMHVREGGDEVVRLVEGTLTVQVSPLASGERFRVVTGDGAVEVRGTVFDVTASQDKLASVAVVSGRVKVVPSQGPAVVVMSDERWSAPAKAVAGSLAAAPEAEGNAVSAPVSVATKRRSGEPRDAKKQRSVRKPATSAVSGRDDSPQTPQQPPPEGLVPAGPTPAPAAPKEALPRETESVGSGFQTAWRAFKAKDYRAAERAFGAILASGGGALRQDAAFWRAVSLKRMGRSSEASAALAAFIKGYPGSARRGEAAVLLGWLKLRAGEEGAARRLFESATQDRSARVRARASKGLAALASKVE